MTTEGPRITAIMPVFDGMGYLERSLPPLLRMVADGRIAEVLVADDGSTDGSGAWAAERGARVITTGGREGPGRARNLAAPEAVGEILWFVDADVVVHDDAVGPLAAAFADPSVTAGFGSYDDAPPDPSFASQYMNLRHHHHHQRAAGEASTFWTGCGAVRKAAFLEVGGFDAERYPRPSIEDIELGYRLRAAGGRIRTLPDVRCTHLKAWTLPGVVHTDITCRGLPWSRLLVASDEPLDLNADAAEQARAALAAVLALSCLAALAGVAPLWLPVAVFGSAVAANARFFGLLRQRRGLAFALGALAFHQVHYLYSAGVFVYCWLEHRLGLRPQA